MKQTDWKIIYTKYEGIAKKAIELLSKEVSEFLIREPHVYSIYVLPCEKEGCAISKNAFFVSCYEESAAIKQYVSAEEVPEDGFLVKVIPTPAEAEGRLVILTAHTEQELFYAVVSFLDDYIYDYSPICGSNYMPDRIFDRPLPECAYTEVPDNKTRSIFTWGHPINDYRAYIENMARLKFNELIIWNDFIPVNIVDIIDYAHSFGIKVILGYSWGWQQGCGKIEEITDQKIENIKTFALQQFRDHYAGVPCDGIYFQSFTERREEQVGGRLISRLVVDMVNDIASRIWQIQPGLRIIFGLHATSVRKRLDEIARVDPRIDIMWEDCGEFPYSYNSFVSDEKIYEETLAFTKEILELRGGVGVGLVFKGVMMLDWGKKVGQHGPFIMGQNSKAIAAHDRHIRASSWRKYAADWMQHGDRAAQMLQFIKDHKLGEVDMCLAGTFDGGIYLPMALCGQMYRTLDDDYQQTLRKTARRACITTD